MNIISDLQRVIARTKSAAGGKELNLALQGGGAHGAFTWGAIDALSREGRLRFGGVSGTSAGAVNAVGLAAGLMEGGPEGAREKLAEIWLAIAELGKFNPLRFPAFEMMSRMMVAPAAMNPLDIDPLRELLTDKIDFKALKMHSPVDLFIAATDVANGQARIFTTPEISADVVLASSCLPQMRPAVKIGRHHYWDGGYSANPALMPLVCEASAEDTLLVQLDPIYDNAVPTSAREILDKTALLAFGQPLRREIELIERCRTEAEGLLSRLTGRHSRLRRHRFHLIDASNYTRELGQASKLHADRELLTDLHNEGKKSAQKWLKKNFKDIGRRATVDLAGKFL